MANATIVIATLETSSFTFDAVGGSEASALYILKDTIKAHCKQYPDADAKYFAECIADGGVEYRTLLIGGGYRDGEQIHAHWTHRILLRRTSARRA